MTGDITAPELARRLRVDPKALRRWLRDLATRGHPLTVGHERWARWRFSSDEADALAGMYERQRAQRTRSSSGRDLIIQFSGFQSSATPFDEFLTFLQALFDLYRSAEVPAEAGLSEPPVPSLRRIKAGSPVDLEWVFEAVRDSPATIAAVAFAVQQIAKALNQVLDGRARRRLIASQTGASDRRSGAEVAGLEAETRAETQESRARVARIEAETREIEDRHATTMVIAAERALLKPPLIVVDPAQLLATPALDAGLMSGGARRAVALLDEGPIEVDIVTIRWARRRRRR